MKSLQILRARRGAKTIPAIKHLRKVCEIGLAAAKHIVDNVLAGTPSHVPLPADASVDEVAQFLEAQGFDVSVSDSP